MSRKPDPERLQALVRTVQDYPGERPAGLASLLGLPRSEVTRLLPALEAQGYLLCEDERGGLWPFRPPKLNP